MFECRHSDAGPENAVMLETNPFFKDGQNSTDRFRKVPDGCSGGSAGKC